MSSTTSFYEPKSLISDKPSTDVETADSQFCDKETVTDYADDLDYNHEHEDEEYNATSRGLTVVFKDLEYIVRNQADRKSDISLLKRVTGVLHLGLMSALMGPSGSGKTTLLDCLAGRKTAGKIEGTILYAGQSPSKSFLRRFTGYVEQFDTLLPNLTVYEQLLYTSELKNPQKESLSRKRERVEKVLEHLALSSCRDITIGSALRRGISGGQCKRVNIGNALVTNPRVLFLDEPTSGLDSYTANEVMLVVKNLVKTGMTICATIHSPTPFAFNLFDRLMVLLGGSTVYLGRNGMDAVAYFEDTNPHLPPFGSTACEKDNPAEWIVDVITQADRDGRGELLAEAYEKNLLSQQNEMLVVGEVAHPEMPSSIILKELRTKKATSTSFFFALFTILKFRLRRDFCDPAYLGPRIIDKLVIALITATLFWKLGNGLKVNPPQNDIIVRTQQFQAALSIGAMLFMQTILPAFAASTYTPSLVLERTTFYRERADGLFTPLCYLMSKFVGELVIAFFNCVAFGSLTFYVVGLNGSFPCYFLIIFCTTSFGIALGYLTAAVSPNMEVANAILPAYVISMLYFVGLLLRIPSMPHYWRWFIWVNPLHYAWVANMINEFQHSNVIVPYNGPILPYYGISPTQSKWIFLGYEACFFVGAGLLAWLSFHFIKHQKR